MNPITREESLLDGQDLTPITRKEQFIKRIYDKTQEIPEPITREEYFLKKAGESTSPVAIEQLNVTENGTYSETGKAYSPVIVEVPAPTLITKTITENGTYTASEDNADGYSQVTVAVEGFKKKSIANTPTDIASFNDGTANPMPSLEISIEPVQSGSGDPSPSNVRPISGWSGANVTRTGKNILSINEVYGNKTGITINDNVATGKTSSFFSAPFNIPKNLVGKQLTLSVKAVVPNSVTSVYTQATVNNVNIYGNRILSNTTGVTSVTFTPESTEDSFRITYGDGNDIITVSDLQVEIGTPTNYSPYQGSTLSIPFHDSSNNPITVYGGQLNVTTGELTATMASVDLGTLNWEIGYTAFIARITNPAPADNDAPANMLCNKYPIKAYAGQPQKSISRVADTGLIRFVDSDYESTAAVKTAMNGVQLVYELATPITYQLTPTQVTTLLGQNNIFADCGQILDGEYFVTL